MDLCLYFSELEKESLKESMKESMNQSLRDKLWKDFEREPEGSHHRKN